MTDDQNKTDEVWMRATLVALEAEVERLRLERDQVWRRYDLLALVARESIMELDSERHPAQGRHAVALRLEEALEESDGE